MTAAGVQVLEAGLATHYVPSQSLKSLEDTLHSMGANAKDSGAIDKAITSIQVGSEV